MKFDLDFFDLVIFLGLGLAFFGGCQINGPVTCIVTGALLGVVGFFAATRPQKKE